MLKFSQKPSSTPEIQIDDEINTPFTPNRPWETPAAGTPRQVTALHPLQGCEPPCNEYTVSQYPQDLLYNVSPIIPISMSPRFRPFMIQPMLTPVLAPSTSGCLVLSPSFHSIYNFSHINH
jgi:hypothetical protein